MSDVQRWQYRSSVAEGWEDGGIGVFCVGGIMTPDASLAVIRDNADWVKATGTVGQVVRYDACCMAIDAESLLRNARSVAACNRSLEAPTALLVHADQHELFSTYADLMAEAGILRSVFLDLHEALRWARAMAPIHVELRGAERRARYQATGPTSSTAVAWCARQQAVPAVSQIAARAVRRLRSA